MPKMPKQAEAKRDGVKNLKKKMQIVLHDKNTFILPPKISSYHEEKMNSTYVLQLLRSRLIYKI